jgi:hypothetical protein
VVDTTPIIQGLMLWALLSLAGAEAPGGSPEGFAAIPRFNRCGES